MYPKRSDGNLHLIDMMLIVKKVKELLPELVIEQYGEPHVLVEFITRRRKLTCCLFLSCGCFCS